MPAYAYTFKRFGLHVDKLTEFHDFKELFVVEGRRPQKIFLRGFAMMGESDPPTADLK